MKKKSQEKLETDARKRVTKHKENASIQCHYSKWDLIIFAFSNFFLKIISLFI